MLNCLGNQWFGKDVDRICSYNTPKIVKFRHRELGCLSKSLKLLICIYILVYLIWYKGKHFEVFQIHGLNQVTFHHPTMNMCNPKLRNCHSNFTRFDDLTYCKGSPSGNATQLPCLHYDGIGLPVPYRGGVLVPTRVRKYNQDRECEPNEDNEYKCERIWDFLDSSGNPQTQTKPKPVQQNYVADIEKFTMLIDHSFSTPELGIGNDDYQMQGYWMDCEHEGKSKLKPVNCKKRPIVCMRKKCKPWMVTGEKFKKQASQNFLASPDDDEESEFVDFVADDEDDETDAAPPSLADGLHHNLEQVTLEGHHLLNNNKHHLLKSSPHHSSQPHKHSHHVIDEIRYPEMAMIAEQAREGDLAKSVAAPFVSLQHGDVLSIGHLLKMAAVDLDDMHFGKTYRWRGLVLVVSITYSNKKPWQLWEAIDPPEYTIEVTRRPSYDFQLDQPVPGPAMDQRTYMSYHGIYIVVEQRGEMLGFSFVHLLVIFSGALSLLKLANMATDYAACNLIANKEEVKNLKYEESRDFYPDS